MDKYKGAYVGKNGKTFTITGTLPECANWANNVTLINGEGTITITKIPEEKDD